jgi:nitrate reductase gamma subunit
MLPWKKETARLHLSAYALGVAYHIGGFLAFLWVLLLFAGAGLPPAVTTASVGILIVAALCGVALLVRRIADAKLRHFSTPDDYFSNALVTGFQVLTALALLYESLIPALFLYSGLLMMYIPLGKLRHAIFFVFARFYLGIFYGRRGVWPPESKGSRQP